MTWSSLRRPLAIAVVFGLVTLTSADLLLAGAPSTLTGRVVAQNGADPRAGVVVTLVEPASERAYRSSPTDARGAFKIDAAPAGSYALVVEAPEGAFLASGNLQLAPGMNRPVSLALKAAAEGEAPPAGTKEAPPAKKQGELPTWAKWVIAGGVIVGAAIVIDSVTKNEEASPSNF
jgi:hypothetical protein